MVVAVERLVNLALYLASTTRPVTAEEIGVNVPGYPAGQDEAAFKRMFERDKDDLRLAGLAIAVERGDTDRYRLDDAATFAGPLELDPREAMQLRAAAAAALADTSFPYAADLRLALAKLTAADGRATWCDPSVLASLGADEEPGAQGDLVAMLTAAATSRKRARFSYTSADARGSVREVEPWGLFAREGRWYLVARDRAADAPRVFAVPRIRELRVEESRPRTPDFTPPEGFDVRAWMLMPFQFGDGSREATLVLTGQAARNAPALTAGQGRLRRVTEASIEWSVPVADVELLARWAVENGPGIRVISPADAVEALRSGLGKVAALHGER